MSKEKDEFLARSKEFDRNTAVYVKGMTAKQIRETLKLPPQH